MNLENQGTADAVDAAIDSLDLDDAPDTEGEDLRTEDDSDEEVDEAEASEDDESESDDEDEDEDDEEEASAKDAKPKRNRTQKRIDQLTRKAGDAERERDYYKNLYEESRFSGNQTRHPTQQEYDYGAQQGYSREDVEAWVQQAADERIQAAEFSNVVSKVEDTLRSGGAEEALARFSNPALTNFYPEAMETLHTAKYPAQVAKAIAGSEELFQQFRSANPAGQAALIARVDGRMEARSAQKRSGQPSATPKVRGKSRPPEKHPDDMSQAEYEAWTKK